MSDRVGALDGRVSIVTAPGYGTVVSGTVPLRPEAEAGDPAVSPRLEGERVTSA